MPINSESTPDERSRRRRRPRRPLALLTALVLAVSAIACGSDDGDDNGGSGGGDGADSSEPLSRSDYLTQVNDVQTEFASEAAQLNLANPSSPTGFKKSLDQLVVLIDGLEDDLDAIEPPEEVGTQHDKLVDGLSDYGNAIETQKDGLSSDDRSQVVSAAQKIGSASTEFSQQFDATIDQINANLK